MITIHRGNPADSERIAQLYRTIFPDTTRSMLGERTCINYIKAIFANNTYHIFIAKEEQEILGFAVVHTSLINSIPEDWLYKDVFALARLVLLHPVYAVKQLRIKLLNTIQEKQVKASSQKQPGTGKSFVLTTGYIDEIGVLEKARGRGVGRMLLDECITSLEETDLEFVSLTVAARNHPAIRFYEKAGFARYSYSKLNNTYNYRIKL